MIQKYLNRPLVSLCVAALTWLTFTSSVQAHPYATTLTNTAGTISFRLNEAADSVKILWNAGGSSFDLGPVAKGLTITNLSGPGVTDPFEVEVTKAGSGVPTLISDNNNTFNQFERPNGVAVNKRPASPYFGRIYVANARTSPTGTGRPMGDGIYILNADSTDAVGQGNAALAGGIDFATGSTSSPWRIRVGADDDMLYVTDWSDSAGNLWQLDPNVSPGSGTNVFQVEAGPLDGTGAGLPPGYTHGSVSEVYVTGSLATGDLTVYTVDEDYETNPGFLSELNSLWQYDIGSANSYVDWPWSNAPNAKIATPSITFTGQTMGLDRGTNGYWYLLDARSNGGEAGLQVIDPAGPTVLYDSYVDSTVNYAFGRDILSNSVSVAVSPDQKYMAVQRNNGPIVVVPLVNGIPNLAGRIEFSGNGTVGRQIVFDAANNIYVVSNNTERMRIYSLGLTTTATTGSAGTFSITSPATTVSVAASTDTIYEAGPTTSVLTFTRAGEPLVNPLTVSFSTAGTAVRGTDYVLQTNAVTFTGNSVIIPAGVDNVTVSLIATDDATAELTETATVSVVGTTFYSAGVPASQTVAIVDNEPATADLTVVQGSMYERLANDYLRLRVVRRGDTNAASFNVNLTYTGTALPGRYTAPATVQVDPGVVNQNFDIAPVDDALLQGSQTIIANVQAGGGYVVGTNSPTATGTIVDDEVPAENVLWSENFNTDNSANWTLRTGSGNGIDDYRYAFSMDYASGVNPVVPKAFPVLPPAPHSTADTRGVYLTANKDEGSALGAAGINIYPNGKVFSNNFAVRFDMYLMVGNAPSTTEYALFGINHSGNNTNWFRNSAGGITGGTFDGLFYGVEADAAALGDYVIYSAPTTAGNNPTALTGGVNASTLTGTFKAPPFGFGGAVGNIETSVTPSWSDVEISQIGTLVSLRINNTLIMRYTNATAFTNGNIMLGYADAYDSIMAGESSVIYDNLRVVGLTLPITSIQKVGSTIEVTFTWGIDEATTAFRLQTANVVTGAPGTYTDSAATITKLSPGVYKAVIPVAGAAQFYRVRYAIP